jgi:superoxide reductase
LQVSAVINARSSFLRRITDETYFTIKPINQLTNQLNQREDKMAERLEVYKCEACGNMVEVIHGGAGELVCCGEAMQLLVENTVDAAKEKHVPVVEQVEGGVKVKVGDVAHPMEDKHYIEWIQIIDGDKAERQFLNPGEAPEAVFKTASGNVVAREFCNLHGLWKG